MIIDKLTEFCATTAVNAAAGTALVGSQIDTGSVVRDLGNGKPVYLILIVTTAFTSGGSATVAFKLASDASAAVATDGSATDHITTKAFPYTELTAGTKIVRALPAGIPAYERYLGLLCVTATATTTAGSISAFLSHDPMGWTATADATN